MCRFDGYFLSREVTDRCLRKSPLGMIASAAACLLLLAVCNVAVAFPGSGGSCTSCHWNPGGSLAVTPDPLVIPAGSNGLLTFDITSLGGASKAAISVQGLENPPLEATIGTGDDNWTFMNGTSGMSYVSDYITSTGPYTLDLHIGASATAGDYPIVVMFAGDGWIGLETGFIVSVLSATTLAGDLNADGFVGIADLNLVLGNWNQNVTPGSFLDGDPSGDGFVGIADLNVVLGNWNAGVPPGAPTGASTNIPEPASSALLLSGIALLISGTKRGV